MKSDLSKDELIKQITNKTIPVFNEDVQELIGTEKHYLEEQLNNGIEELQQHSFDEVMPRLISRLYEDKENLSRKWAEAIREIAQDLPEEVELPQAEARFFGTEEDSLYMWSGKAAKRVRRSVEHLSTRLTNRFRWMFNTPPRPLSQWTHKVPARELVIFHLLELQQWMGSWQQFRERFIANLLYQTDRWILETQGVAPEKPSDGEEKQQNEEQPAVPEKLIVLFEEQLSVLNEFHRTHIEKLKPILLEVKHDILRDLETVGTFEKDSEPYTDEKLAQKEEYYLTVLEEKKSTWTPLQEALNSELFTSLDFMRLKEKIEEESAGVGEAVNELFSSRVEEPSQKLQEKISEGLQQLQDLEGNSVDELGELSDGIRKAIMQIINNDILQQIDEVVEHSLLSQAFGEYTSKAADMPDMLSEKMMLINKFDLDKSPPEYSLDEVNWQALVRRVLSDRLIKELLPEKLQPEAFFVKIGKEYREIAQIIEINLEMADQVSGKDSEQPVEVAVEGLQRAQAKVGELDGETEQKKEEMLSLLRRTQNEALSKITTLLKTQDVGEVKWAGAQYQAKETAVGWKTAFSIYYARIADKAELLSRFIWKKAKTYNKQLNRILGFREEKELEEKKADLATFLSHTDEKIAQLPFIYRKLFDFSKQVDSRFYMRRPEQFERFKKAYDLWQKDFPSTLSVVGEKGSGKTTFLKLLSEEVLTEHQIITVKFEKTCWTESDIISTIADGLKIDDVSSADDLIEKIQNKRKRVIVFLEDIQNCYVRYLSGYQGIERLLYLISETNNKVLWTVSCSSYAWSFLDKVQNAGDYFTHIAQTDRLDADQIESVILKRHKASGYQLRFLTDKAAERSRSYRKVMDDDKAAQQHLQDRYFEKLANLAEGNASIAIILWIGSIRDYDDTHFYIEPFNAGAIQGIEDLEQSALFTFAAMVLHDTLTPKELGMVLNESLQESKLIISRQTSRGILVKGPNGYTLNQLVYRQILRELKERNLIH